MRNCFDELAEVIRMAITYLDILFMLDLKNYIFIINLNPS
jgi:hypothetical protein